MSDVVVFHHAQGLTEGVRAFARTLTDAGHTVTAPDLYDGATFATVADGIAHAQQMSFDTVLARGHAAVAELFLYPGDAHLFADSSVSDYVPAAAALLTERVLAFLAAAR